MRDRRSSPLWGAWCWGRVSSPLAWANPFDPVGAKHGGSIRTACKLSETGDVAQVSRPAVSLMDDPGGGFTPGGSGDLRCGRWGGPRWSSPANPRQRESPGRSPWRPGPTRAGTFSQTMCPRPVTPRPILPTSDQGPPGAHYPRRSVPHRSVWQAPPGRTMHRTSDNMWIPPVAQGGTLRQTIWDARWSGDIGGTPVVVLAKKPAADPRTQGPPGALEHSIPDDSCVTDPFGGRRPAGRCTRCQTLCEYPRSPREAHFARQSGMTPGQRVAARRQYWHQRRKQRRILEVESASPARARCRTRPGEGFAQGARRRAR